MKPNIEKHPAYLFGRFLRDQRLIKRIALREWCISCNFDPSKWSEIEHGILKWLTPKWETITLLKLINDTPTARQEFWQKLKCGQTAKPTLTCLGDIFELLEVIPAWPRMRKDGRRQTPEEMIEMAKFILLPLDEEII